VYLAEVLRLYPSKIYSHKDNENLPQMQLMATDGSYIVTPRDCSDILTSESKIRDTGRGAGGIVFLSPGFNHDSPLPNGIRITCDRPEPGMNAFIWKLLNQLIGLHFSKHRCHIARTNRALKTKYNQLANIRGGTFATGSYKFTHPHHPQYFIYTLAHPERFTDRCDNPTMQIRLLSS
jgi:hypothetical protein